MFITKVHVHRAATSASQQCLLPDIRRSCTSSDQLPRVDETMATTRALTDGRQDSEPATNSGAEETRTVTRQLGSLARLAESFGEVVRRPMTKDKKKAAAAAAWSIGHD